MGLIVSAQAVRDLISEGDYVVECIEQREHGRVGVTLALRSRAQPYTIHIETGDNKLTGLFRALLNGKDSGKKGKPVIMAGNQPVPVVQVDAMPADQPKRRRRAEGATQLKAPEPSSSVGPLTRAKRRQSAMRQLLLVPQDSSPRPAQPSERPKRRAR